MKSQAAKPRYPVINIAGLALIYLLLTGMTVFLVRSFFTEILSGGAIPATENLSAFFIVPAALLVFLVILAFGVLKDWAEGKTAGRFQARLFVYFVIIIVFTASPMIIITNLAVGEFIRFWKNIDIDTAMEEAQRFAMESYTQNMERVEYLAERGDFSGGDMPDGVLAFQDFIREDKNWKPESFTGKEELRLESLPSGREGFVPRELPRDANLVRYIMSFGPGKTRLISWSLGDGFDPALEIIRNEQEHFLTLDSIRFNITRLLLFYYGIFSLPALLMTLIIAITFTRRVSFPITELSEATRLVATGDFTTRLLPRKSDELAPLVSSFNSMAEELERSQAAMLKAEKISLWQNIAQQLAHEIKNPLTPIRLSAERVLRRWRNDPEKIGEIIESSMLAIIQEAEGISTLLTEFRSFSKPSEPSLERTDARELVEEIAGAYRPSYPEVTFNIDYTGEKIPLKIDRIRLYQVLGNLVTNSIDAMNGVGSIEIRTDIVKKRENSYCRLSIQDDGKGISKEDARQIFAPYFTTKNSGTGLGLPIVERIVNDHGGAIWFDSARGAGTTFFIDLPLEGEDL